MESLRSREIVEQLDRVVVGQPDAKRAIATAIRARWRAGQSGVDTPPEQGTWRYLITGTRGTGKTTLVQQAARITGAPFVRVSLLQLAAGDPSRAGKRTLESLVRSAKELHPEVDDRQAVRIAEQEGMILIDGIERWVRGGDDDGPEPLLAAQRAIYDLAAGDKCKTRFGWMNTGSILQFATGNWSSGRGGDVAPEVQMLFPNQIQLDQLEREDLAEILAGKESSLLAQYIATARTEGIILEFTRDAIDAIVDEAVNRNRHQEDIGARRLQEVLEDLLDDLLFEGPGNDSIHQTIDAAFVAERATLEREDEDLDDFIL